MKAWICIVTGALGGVVAAVFGGWTFALTALCILMGLDYISGLVVAGVFHRSPKSLGGGLESHAGLKGLIRKVAVLCVVVVAHLIDRLIGTEYLRDATAIAFSLNEIISILENVGLMGVKMPAVLVKALDVLRQKAGEENSDNTSSASVPSAPSPQGEGDTDEQGSSLRRDVEAPSPKGEGDTDEQGSSLQNDREPAEDDAAERASDAAGPYSPENGQARLVPTAEGERIATPVGGLVRNDGMEEEP